MRINKATQKAIKRGIAAVAVGVITVLIGKPQYAPLSGAIPFLIRWGTPSDKDITFAKDVIEGAREFGRGSK